MTLTTHGDTRVDDWYWLRDRDDPDVIAYLEAENEWAASAMAHTEQLQEQIFEEIKGRIQETDVSAPVGVGPWWYYTRTQEGRQYGIHCRRLRSRPDEPAVDALSNSSAEEVVLDENALAEGHDYFSLGNFEVSPDHRLLAFAIDVEGDETYTLRVRDLDTGDDFTESIPGTYYGLEWASDNRTLFYTVLDDAKRPWQVKRHALGDDPATDVVLHEESDEAFHVGLGKTRSEEWILVALHSMVTSEVRVLPAADPTAALRTIAPRRQDVEYDVDHQGDRFLITTNEGGAENFKLVEAPVDNPGPEQWREVVPHRPDVRLLGAAAFAAHVVLYERAEGLTRLRVLSGADEYTVEQPEPVHTTAPGYNPEYDTTTLRFQYTSLVTPMQSVDLDMETRTRTVVKQQPVLGGYDPSHYRTERAWATAADGTQVPVSIAFRADRAEGGPALLYGYGSYEHSIDPTFSAARLSLLDRGFLFAIAHVRGGGELGRHWYEDGKLLHKRNTFTDFIAAAELLVGEGRTTPAALAARGGSAGGLLMGAVANLRPDLFGAIVAEVPFVDALTTILDESLPLTVIEWEEWGNPVKDPEVYFYMKSYAPYDNVEAKAYPAMLVRGGLNDPRVGFWEPAKWVAKLRATKTDDNALVLKTDMGAGHGGPSGRYDAWRDEAYALAFVIDTVGVQK